MQKLVGRCMDQINWVVEVEESRAELVALIRKRSSSKRQLMCTMNQHFKLLTKMVLNFLNFSTFSQFLIVKLLNNSLLLRILELLLLNYLRNMAPDKIYQYEEKRFITFHRTFFFLF